MNRAAWLVLAVACVTGAPRLARAEGSPAENAAAAEVLFKQARKLVAEGHFAEACPKLEESNRLDPGLGTRFHLADCYERLGRTASAWAGFLEVADAARRAGRGEEERVAKGRAAALEPRLFRLRIQVAESVSVVEVRRDGVLVGRAQWGIAVPVDPGAHVVSAAAPGKKPWSIQVQGTAGSEDVLVPPLEAAPATSAPATSAPRPRERAEGPTPAGAESGAGRRTAGYVVGGAGVVALGLGGYFGLRAFSKWDERDQHCGPTGCDAAGVAAGDDAKAAAWVSNVGLGVGLVAVAFGAYLVFTAPSAPVRVAASPRALGAQLEATW